MNVTKIIEGLLNALRLRGAAAAERHLSKLDKLVAALRKAEEEISNDLFKRADKREADRIAYLAADEEHDAAITDLNEKADRAMRVADKLADLVG